MTDQESSRDRQTIERAQAQAIMMCDSPLSSDFLNLFNDLLDLAERLQRKAEAWNMVEPTLDLRKHTHAEKRDIWASARKHAKGDDR